MDATIRELEAYAKSPYIAGRKPKFIYFGGGTPSYLSAQQLTELTDRMKRSFHGTKQKKLPLSANQVLFGEEIGSDKKFWSYSIESWDRKF